jgi:excisionase family DNA binding protein
MTLQDSNAQARGPGQLLTAKQVARDLNVSLRTVRRLIAQQKLPVVRIGKAVRITPEALAAFIGEE